MKPEFFFDKLKASDSQEKVISDTVDAFADTPFIKLMTRDPELMLPYFLGALGVEPALFDESAIDIFSRSLDLALTNQNPEEFFKNFLRFSMQWASENVTTSFAEVVVKVIQPCAAFYKQNRETLAALFEVYKSNPDMQKQLEIYSKAVAAKGSIDGAKFDLKLKDIFLKLRDIFKDEPRGDLVNRHGELLVSKEYAKTQLAEFEAESKAREVERAAFEVKSKEREARWKAESEARAAKWAAFEAESEARAAKWAVLQAESDMRVREYAKETEKFGIFAEQTKKVAPTLRQRVLVNDDHVPSVSSSSSLSPGGASIK